MNDPLLAAIHRLLQRLDFSVDPLADTTFTGPRYQLAQLSGLLAHTLDPDVTVDRLGVAAMVDRLGVGEGPLFAATVGDWLEEGTRQ